MATYVELRQAAIDCLERAFSAKAFKRETTIPVHVIQAAVSVLVTPVPDPTKG